MSFVFNTHHNSCIRYCGLLSKSSYGVFSASISQIISAMSASLVTASSACCCCYTVVAAPAPAPAPALLSDSSVSVARDATWRAPDVYTNEADLHHRPESRPQLARPRSSAAHPRPGSLAPGQLLIETNRHGAATIDIAPLTRARAEKLVRRSTSRWSSATAAATAVLWSVDCLQCAGRMLVYFLLVL